MILSQLMFAYVIGECPSLIKQSSKDKTKNTLIVNGVIFLILMILIFFVYVPLFLPQFTIATNVSIKIFLFFSHVYNLSFALSYTLFLF